MKIKTGIYILFIALFCLPVVLRAQLLMDQLPYIRIISPTNHQEVPNPVVFSGNIAQIIGSNSITKVLISVDTSEPSQVYLNGFSWSTNLKLSYGEHTLTAYALDDDGNRLQFRDVKVTIRIAMTVGGWIFMISAWLFIIILNIFTFSHIFGIRKEKIVEPLEIDTQDE